MEVERAVGSKKITRPRIFSTYTPEDEQRTIRESENDGLEAEWQSMI